VGRIFLIRLRGSLIHVLFMYLPQFTTRNLFLMVAGAGFLFLFLNRAVDGQAWAIGVSLGLISILLLFACCALLFFFVWLLRLMVPTPEVQAQNPFVSDRPPEQIIPPANLD